MAYQPSPNQTEGGQKETRTSDDNVQILLSAILKELKLMNIQLALITDEEVAKEEIE